jgi:hypothetical protein
MGTNSIQKSCLSNGFHVETPTEEPQESSDHEIRHCETLLRY